MGAPLCKAVPGFARASCAPEAQERPTLPWNDSSKPGVKPGPWDPPAQGERNAPAGAPDPDSSDQDKPVRQRPQAPWSRGDNDSKPRETRPVSASEPRKTSAPPPRGPQLDELSRQLRAGVQRIALRPSGRGVRPGLLAGAFVAILAVWGLSGVYVVQAGQTGVVTRFGALIGRTGPGLHYHLPTPVEAVQRLTTGGVNRLEIGSATSDTADSQMLTRDGDLVNLAFTVQWRLVDPVKYLFQLAEPDATLKSAAEGALRAAVGQTSLADILASGRGGASTRAAGLMQAALDRDDAGVKIVGLEINDAQPPEGAQGGFHDIAAATADAQTQASDAQAYRSRVVADARGEVAKAVQTAQGYRDQEIAEARGEADRFALVDAQYRKAPGVTRDRLYSETMERVLHNTRKVIVQATPGANIQITLPPDLVRPKPADPTPTPAPSSAPAQAQGADASSTGQANTQGDALTS